MGDWIQEGEWSIEYLSFQKMTQTRVNLVTASSSAHAKSHAKEYSFNIDWKDFENIVSLEMVDKIKLKIEPHVEP